MAFSHQLNPSNSFTVNSIDQMSCFPVDVVGCYIAGRYSGIVVKVAAAIQSSKNCVRMELLLLIFSMLMVDFAVAARDKSAGSFALLVSDVPTH